MPPMTPFKLPSPMRYGNIRVSISNGETEPGRCMQGTEGTVWAKTQGQKCPPSSLLVPNCPSSPWIGESRFWKSSSGAIDEEATQTNNFLKYQHQRKFKRSCSLLPYQTFHGDSNFHKKGGESLSQG